MIEIAVTFVVQLAVIMAVTMTAGERLKWETKTQDKIIFVVSMVALVVDLTIPVLEKVR